MSLHLVPNTSCGSVAVRASRLEVGLRARLRITVRVGGKAVTNALVRVKGGGISRTATTGPSGIVTLSVRPTGKGWLKVTVPNLTVCARRLAVARSRGTRRSPLAAAANRLHNKVVPAVNQIETHPFYR